MILFTNPDEVHLLMTQVCESASLQTADIREAVLSFKACDFPVVGGPTNTEKMLSGISCVPMTSVELMPATKDVVVRRLVMTYPVLVLSECALFSMKVSASSSNRSLKGLGRPIRRFCNRAHILSGCFRSLARSALDIVDVITVKLSSV